MSTEIIKKEIQQIDEQTIKSYLTANDTKLSNQEFAMFFNIAKMNNLNPFNREIHIIKYKDNFNIVTGYQVYLQRAEDTKLLDGWNCQAIFKSDKLTGAKIEIYRKDMKNPIVWQVLLKEFWRQTPVWRQMPEFMIKKVCIGQGFRLAFPSQLSGLPYLREELEQNEEKEYKKSETKIEPEPKSDLKHDMTETEIRKKIAEYAEENEMTPQDFCKKNGIINLDTAKEFLKKGAQNV